MINIKENNDWLQQQASANPNAAAIISDGLYLDYSQLNEHVVQTACRLRTLGIKAGTQTAIVCENSSDFIIVVLSLWKLSAIPIPLNTRLKAFELEELYKLSSSSFLLIHKSLVGNYNFSNEIHLLEIPISSEDNFKEDLSSPFTENDDALIMFTSGTTGEPKGVIHTFKSLYQSVIAVDSLVNHSVNDKWLASLPFYHIGGFSIITRALLSGTPIILPNSLKTEDIAQSLETYKPTLASFVPTTLKRLLEGSRQSAIGNRLNAKNSMERKKVIKNKELRTVFLGGGPIEANLVKEAIYYGWPIVKVYGSTETASMVAAASTEELKHYPSTGAKPILDNKIVALNDKGEILGVNKKGQIAVACKSIMKGYLTKDYEKSKKMSGDYYLTGDFGYIDEKGYLTIEGRMDDIIISGGENIHPREIEEAILKYPEVKDVIVFKAKDNEWGEVPCAGIILSDMANLTKDDAKRKVKDLKSFLTQNLSSFKIPKKFFILKKLPQKELGETSGDIFRELLKLK